jgi:hypothetical protein
VTVYLVDSAAAARQVEQPPPAVGRAVAVLVPTWEDSARWQQWLVVTRIVHAELGLPPLQVVDLRPTGAF